MRFGALQRPSGKSASLIHFRMRFSALHPLGKSALIQFRKALWRFQAGIPSKQGVTVRHFRIQFFRIHPVKPTTFG
jgi:hypothetical protein